MSKRPPRLVYNHSLVLKKRLLSPSLSVILARHRALIGLQKLFAKSGDQSAFTKFHIACCSCFARALLIAPCFAHCCHDPFIVRNASNLSTVPWFHSVCVSVSMFAINIDNCCFCFCASVSESASGLCVHAEAAALHQIHHRLRQPSSCSGVWDPWPCRIPILHFEQHCNTEALIGIFPIFVQFFS